MGYIGSINIQYNSELANNLLKKEKNKTVSGDQDSSIISYKSMPKGTYFVLHKSGGRKTINCEIKPLRFEPTENRLKLFKSAADWIKKDLPQAKIIGAYWGDTAGYARYQYIDDKLTLVNCGDHVIPEHAVIHRIMPGRWAKAMYGDYVSEQYLETFQIGQRRKLNVESWLTLDENGKILHSKKTLSGKIRAARNEAGFSLFVLVLWILGLILYVGTVLTKPMRSLFKKTK